MMVILNFPSGNLNGNLSYLMGITTSNRSLRRSKCLVLHSTGLCKSPTLLPLQFLALNGLLALTPRSLPSGNAIDTPLAQRDFCNI